MLINFKTKNFCSFKEEAVFSLKPGKVTKRFENNVINIKDKIKISKFAVIVGENAGGKTSFIKAIHFFKTLICSDGYIRSIKSFCYNFDDNIPQSFEISALVDEKIYTYSLEIDSLYILSEKLYVRSYSQPEAKNQYIFKSIRTNCKKDLTDSNHILSEESDLDINDKLIPREFQFLSKNGESSKLKSKSSIFLKILYTLNAPIIKPFYDWIHNNLIVDISKIKDNDLNIYKDILESERRIEILKKPEFLDIFKLVDSSIVGIEIDEKYPFTDTKIVRRMKDNSSLIIKLSHDSTGVIAFFSWGIQLWKVIYEDATLFADEMDDVLNVILASKIINYMKANVQYGQFIFSTHNIFHLNTIDYMKEQLFFIGKNVDTLSSELYTLADFKEYSYEQPEVYNLYLKGLLGATPNE